jgi:gamma-glutamyl hydrolase
LWFNQTDGYAEAGRHIYEIASELNEAGDYFPLWGTCLGFELLTYLSANGNEHRASCFSQNQALPLEFKSDFRSSRLFAAASDEVIEILRTQPVTPNFHQFCVTEKVLAFYRTHSFIQIFDILSAELDGLPYRSRVESDEYES